MSTELVSLDELMARSDFVTLHLAKTPETINLINAELLAKAKPDMRIINVARGGIINEADLADAVRNKVIAGAAIDVFDSEPCTESPLFDVDEIIVTPHLGASTVEAQDKAGDTIADMVKLALSGEFVPFAVNVSAGEVSETVRPYQALAETLGGLLAGLAGGAKGALEISYDGQIAEYDTRILTLSVLKGFFGAISEDPVSYVNAPQMAADKGIDVNATQSTTPKDYVNLITVRIGSNSIAGTLAGLRAVSKIVMVDGFAVDIRPSANMLVVRNDDVPGMIGLIGTAVGASGVNISDMVVGEDADGVAALMVLSTSEAVADSVVADLEAREGIVSVNRVRG